IPPKDHASPSPSFLSRPQRADNCTHVYLIIPVFPSKSNARHTRRAHIFSRSIAALPTALSIALTREFALETERLLQNPFFYFNGYTNGCGSYFPTKEEYSLGGYEVYWSMLLYFADYHCTLSSGKLHRESIRPA